MALIKCPECEKEISDKAKACPHCGCPIENEEIVETETDSVENEEIRNEDTELINNSERKWKINRKLKVIIGIVALFVLAVIIYYFLTANSREYKEAADLYKKKKYQQAADKFTDLDNYRDSLEMANKCNYEIATSYFDSGEYEKALEIFEKLSNYSDSKEMVEKCNYERTVDGKFMRALAAGLMARWDYSDEGYKKEYDVKSTTELSDSKYMAYLKNCINIELDAVSSFANQEFNNEELQKNAIRYIDLLNGCLKTVDYYSINYEKYIELWNNAYNERVLLVRNFANDYNLDIDEEHQETLNEFISNASVVDEEKKLEADIKKMLDEIDYKIEDKGYGHVLYTLTIKNTSDVTFEYFGLELQLLDKEENVIDSGYSDSISDFKPGKKATVEAYLEEESDSIKFIASYNIKN